MNNPRISRLILVLAAILLPACADEQPPRNTVQHGVIAKADLLGADGKATWYYLQTVVDAPYATGFTFAGEQSLMEKIRWDIQEKVIYARRAYEWVAGTDAASSSPEQGTDPKKIVGAPIAAFTVEKHFDIIRDYNSATGEEINRILENDSDRPWYQRKFVRVDWSKNLLANFEFLVHYDDDAVAPLRQEAVPYYVSDPDDPDALRLRRPVPSAADKTPTANYMEVTTKIMATPEMATEYYDDGTYRLPACYMAEDYGPDFATSDCAAQELKLRHAFMKVGDREYDPLVYDDRWMERFGFFSSERRTYDKQYSETESGRVRLANRFNLWNKTLSTKVCSIKEHYKAGADANKAWRAARADADAACAKAEGTGSRCSLHVEKCTLAPDKRGGTRKITYYLNVGFPDSLRPVALKSVAAWNDAFQTTVARMLYPGDDPKDAAKLAARKKSVGTMFELKDNGCSEQAVNSFVAKHSDLRDRVFKAMGRPSDGAGGEGSKIPTIPLSGKDLIKACAALDQATAYRRNPAEHFIWQRMGDLRYSMLYWMGAPTRAGLLGYGPSSVDPESGEIIQASAFLYGAPHDLYTARSADVVGLLNCKDEACVQKYAKGVPIADWVALVKSGTGPAAANTYSQAEVDNMGKRMKTAWLKVAAKKLPALDWSTLDNLRKSMRKRSTLLASSKAMGLNGGTTAAKLKAIKGSVLEAGARAQLKGGLGLGSKASGAPGGLDDKLSFYNWAGPGMLRERRKAKMHLARRKVELAEFYDNLILGLARRYKAQGKTRDQIFSDLRARLFKAVAEHEVGHTLGLRHNFAGSYDSFNYHPSYWKLRTLGAGGKALPRYKSAMTPKELEGDAKDAAANEGIGSYQYSSVMDYGARFNGDIHGLGYYDRAAIKFGYGQVVEVFDKVGTSNVDKYLLANVQTSIRWGEPMLYTVTCDSKKYRGVHYTEYPRLVGGAANLTAANRVDVPLAKMTTTKLSKVAPGCAVYDWGGLWDSDVPTDDAGRMEVPFRFCSDEYESSSPECAAYDAGADPYEQFVTIRDGYSAYYLFNNLKLDRLGFSLWGYMDTLMWRYFEPLRSSMQFYTLIRGDFTGDPRSASYMGDTELKEFFTADDGYGPWTTAVDRSFDFFLDILATPEVGKYWKNLKGEYTQTAFYSATTGKEMPPDLTLTAPTGRYMASEWDFDSGYFWYDKMSVVGAYHDKYLALWMLTDPETYLLGRDTSSDLRQYALGYHRLYPKAIQRYLRGVFTEDWWLTGHWAANKKLITRDFSSTALPPKDAYPVDPQIGYTVQYFAALLGLALIPQTFDTSFLDSCRIYVKGAKDAIKPTKDEFCFADPFGKKEYCAVSYLNSLGYESGIGAAMVRRAEALRKNYTTKGTEKSKLVLLQYIDSLDLMRSISSTFAYTPF